MDEQSKWENKDKKLSYYSYVYNWVSVRRSESKVTKVADFLVLRASCLIPNDNF